MLRLLLLMVSLAFSAAHADTLLWQDLPAPAASSVSWQGSRAANRLPPLQHARWLKLDEASLLATLSATPTDTLQARAAPANITLPLPDGNFITVNAEPVELLAPHLASQYPEIRAWRVTASDGKPYQGRIGFTSAGFHAMLDMPDGNTLFIDPQTRNDERHYASFSKQANDDAFAKQWSCGTHSTSPAVPNPLAHASKAAARTDMSLNQYRLAIAATAEYAQFHGGQAAAFAAIVTTVNRLNVVFERDLAISFTLVSDSSLVYTDPTSDPYDDADTLQSMNANQTVLDRRIGNSHYDLGHVFSTAGGGLSGVAQLGSVCNNATKGMATSGIAAPIATSSAFYIDIVAHEIGHQFTASHTFNSEQASCLGNRVANTAYETGSGATVMSYSGLCGTDNVQTNSHEAFHIASISQIRSFAHTPGRLGNLCAQVTSRTNSPPSVDAGEDHIIPAGTPFLLSGTGSDRDLDTLTYTWEQVDAGAASSINEDTTNNPLVKVLAANTSPSRTVPDIPLFLRVGNQRGQILPATTRTMHFALVARDGKGAVSHDIMRVNVVDTGTRFAVTSPASPYLTAASDVEVVWNVAATDQEPINCQQVDIDLTADGETYVPLLHATANDGIANVTLPAQLPAQFPGISRNHLRVKCHDNIFFALSATSPMVAAVRPQDDTQQTGEIPSESGELAGGGGGAAALPPELLWLVVLGWWLRRQRFYPCRAPQD
ncbi:MAG: hypothetical protein JG718_07095 [Candidatus Thiothrix moscowensis]|nr:hypothetical protein [Candidatus Thiothrix moscowensis]